MKRPILMAAVLLSGVSGAAFAQSTDDPEPPVDEQPVATPQGEFGAIVQALAQDPDRTGGIGPEVSALARARNEERRLARGDDLDDDLDGDDVPVEGADVAVVDAPDDVPVGIGEQVRALANSEREGGIGEAAVALTPAADAVAVARARASAARENAAEAAASGRQQAAAARQGASSARSNAATARETAATARAQAAAARDNARAASAQARAVRDAVRAARPGRGGG